MRLVENRRPVNVWLLAFAAFFLIGGAWALAAPYDGTPDEYLHVIRAAGVVQGQVLQRPGEIDKQETGAYQTVPAGLVPLPTRHINAWYNWCYLGHPSRSAACGPQPGTGSVPVPLSTAHGGATRTTPATPPLVRNPSAPRTVFTSAGRYNPLYYAAVGDPLVRWPNWTGIILARLISAGLCAAFLASAFVSCLRWRRSPLMTSALLVAATPVALELAGSVNPNAVEIAAGISLGAAAIPLLLDNDSAETRGWLRRAAIAAIALAQLRVLGPIFVAIWIGVLVLPPVRARLRELRQRQSAWAWSAGVAASCVVGIGWTFAAQAAALGQYASHQYTARQVLIHEVSTGSFRYLAQMVDGLGVYDTAPPGHIFMAWAMALGLLVIAALAWGSWTDRWRLAALGAVTLLVPVFSDLATVNQDGYAFQGRYIMPVAVGIPLLAAYIVGRSGAISPAAQASISRMIIVVLLPFQMFTLGWVMIRWQSGVGHSLNPLAGSWHPVVGSALPLLLMILGLALLGVLSWQATQAPLEAAAESPATPAATPAAATVPDPAAGNGLQATAQGNGSNHDGVPASGSRSGQSA